MNTQIAWLLSGRALPIFFLVILPILLLLSHYLIVEYAVPYVSFEDVKGQLTLRGPVTVVFIVHFINGFQYGVFIAIFIAYPLYTYVYPYVCRKCHKPYFKDIVIEFEFIKKILWIAIPLTFIFYYIIPVQNLHFLGIPIPRPPWDHDIGPYMAYVYRHLQPVIDVLSLLQLMTSAGLIKMAFLLARKEFTLDYARGCIQLLSKKKDEVEKMKYLMTGLSSYNKYIRKRLKVSINFFEIYSKIINSPTNERSSSIQQICTAFEGNKLEVISQLSTFFSLSKEQFLTEDSFRNKLQLWGTDIGWLVSAIIGIIGAIVSVVTIFKH
jgi:hypothetical protein